MIKQHSKLVADRIFVPSAARKKYKKNSDCQLVGYQLLVSLKQMKHP